MPNSTTIRIFISSPSDVRPERLKAEQIIARLAREFSYHFHVDAVLWERLPLVAARHFQDPENTPQPRSCDIVVVILWSRLGLPLPVNKFRGAVSRRCPVTGTEWEFEDALAGAREHNGVPHILFYRKTAPITASLDDEARLEERRAQRALVLDFIGRWFVAEDGKGYTAALHSFAATADFEENLYDHLHALLFKRAGAAADVSIRWHEAPFRALLSYEYEHAPVFFGRTRARNELRELLAAQMARSAAFVLVFGASGSGKSSLVKAGLLPDLALPGMIGRVGLVRRALMRPSEMGGDPFAALAAAVLSPTALPELSELQYTPDGLADLLREAPGQAALPIRQGLAAAGKAASLTDIAEARLVIVVDQLEEIFTIDGLGERDRAAFVVALEILSKSAVVWVVATMRSDFFDRLETLPALAALSAEGRFLLLPPEEAEIGQIIRLPAQEAGLRFEHDATSGASLDEAIRQAASHDRGALPLLSFLLDQLWQRRTDAGVLTFAAYRDLGGLEGAIGRRAEEVFQAQAVVVQEEFVPLLRELVTVEEGKPVSRAAPLSRFPEGTPRRALADELLHPEARLLIADSETGRPQLRLAHEALLTHWPRTRDQVASDARDLELRGRLEQQAKAWRDSASRRDERGRLVAGLPLAEARALIARWGNQLPPEIAAFVVASHRGARWRRVRVAATVAAAPVAVALVAVVVWVAIVWHGVRRVEAEWAAEHAFVRIPPAGVPAPYCFTMGSSAAKGAPQYDPQRYPNEGPLHKVCVKPFDLGKYKVTQAEWADVMLWPFFNPRPSEFKGDDRRPVEQVSWNDIHRFLSVMSFFGYQHYRLPSEAEWEYAVRAGTTTSRYWGDNINDGCVYENIADRTLNRLYANGAATAADCDDGYEYTSPIGHFKPNPWGLYDMLGNVQEWVEDCYVQDYDSAPQDDTPVKTRQCAEHVIRGGSWYGNPFRYARSAYRYHMQPRSSNHNIGFRVVREHTR